MAKMSPDPRKNASSSFALFLLVAVLVLLGIQTFAPEKTAKVAFSHQAEHLTNLNLTVPEENRKIAQNENLVTFTGKFRDSQPEESTERYRYLELLNQNHELKASQGALAQGLDSLQKTVADAADIYLHLVGAPLSRSGFTVVGSAYDTTDRNNAIVVQSLSDKEITSLPVVQKALSAAQSSPSLESLDVVAKELHDMVTLLRSPALGVGAEATKTELKAISTQLSSVADLTATAQLQAYRSVTAQIAQMLTTLGREQDGVRLASLRSVRNYVEELQQYTTVSQNLEKNGELLNKARGKVASVIWYFNNQELSTRALEKQDPETFGHWFAQAQQEWKNFNENKGLNYRAPDQALNTVLEKTFKSQEPPLNYFSYILTVLPVAMVVLFLYFIFSKQMKGGVGSSAMSFGKSPARLMTKETNKVTFKDVAGADEAKEELKEIVDFLKDPQKFTALGARIPKGVLLVGPPGTGKTLVARAVAGEADRPFFSISGSDFVEMFVGVGASRIRDMFDQAKKNAPCIIFMDEIDAVGRHRGSGVGGGHDEREQTLNQLLVEMDGFDSREGVILIAATNRPDVLDRALLRPGRFDRRVALDLPDVKGRLEILKVHARKIKMDPSVDLGDIARSTPGSSGADLENVLNEAALCAARKGRFAVTSVELKEACDKVRYGKERRSLEMDEGEKRTTAYHEAGHAIAGLTVKLSDPVDKVTIIPRGFSLGATHFMPKKNRLSYWKKEALDQLIVLMGGRAAEEIFVHDMSSGARHDFMQATRLARSMVCEWGMTDKLGPVAYDQQTETNQYLGVRNSEKDYSDKTAEEIDQTVRQLLDEAYKQATATLELHRDKVELMANMLMEFETLDSTDIKEMMEGSWDSERKKGRLKAADELQKKAPPPPPPLPVAARPPVVTDQGLST